MRLEIIHTRNFAFLIGRRFFLWVRFCVRFFWTTNPTKTSILYLYQNMTNFEIEGWKNKQQQKMHPKKTTGGSRMDQNSPPSLSWKWCCCKFVFCRPFLQSRLYILQFSKSHLLHCKRRGSLNTIFWLACDCILSSRKYSYFL